MKNVKFKCPDCGSNILKEETEKIECCQMTNIIEGEFTRGVDLYDQEHSRIIGYGCAQCGYDIARTEQAAIDWLEEHNMIEESKSTTTD